MLKLDSDGSIEDATSSFTKRKKQECEDGVGRGGGEWREGRNKVDWLFNEPGSVSGSTEDSAKFKAGRWTGAIMKTYHWSQRHLVTGRSN
jgi:hypothetical protein